MTSQDNGAVLDGKYEILDRLASGGMGEVYLVRHLHLQEQRVIKILRPERATDPLAAQRFLQEARVATQIKHPNVAILYDYSQLPDGRFYMVWEHIEGEDVGTWLRNRGPFPLAVGIDLGIQALRGLEAIHAVGVIHRDVSPDNMMITRDARGRSLLKIIDLGLAKNLSQHPDFEITQAGMFMGKLRYCSPEQAGALPEGARLDHRSDLYSFAAVLYEMLCGLPPYDSENQHGFLLKRMNEDPLPLVGRNAQVQIPRELDVIVRRGLERDRENRYSDAVAFIQALARMAERLRGASTQEVAVPGATSGRVAANPAPAAPAADAPIPRELSREERLDLLAQIDRAAKKQEGSAQVLQRAEQARQAGRMDEARQLANQLASQSPRPRGLDELFVRLHEAEQSAADSAHVQEAEALLEKYLKERKQNLAQLALETLLELRPQHARRQEYQERVTAMGAEAMRLQRAHQALQAGREALARNDRRSAWKQMEILQQIDRGGESMLALQAELQEAEGRERRRATVDERRQAFEMAVRAGRVGEAERELRNLQELEITKVTLNLYEEQLAQVRNRAQENVAAAPFEQRFRERVQTRDWIGAREVVEELERALPQSPRPAQMFAEVARLQEEERRRAGIEQGVQQVEAFVAAHDPTRAELALKILLQMDPENPHRKRLEKAVAALWKG